MNFIERLEKNRGQVLLLGKLAKESQLIQSLGSINGLIDELVKSQYDDHEFNNVTGWLNSRLTERETVRMSLIQCPFDDKKVMDELVDNHESLSSAVSSYEDRLHTLEEEEEEWAEDRRTLDAITKAVSGARGNMRSPRADIEKGLYGTDKAVSEKLLKTLGDLDEQLNGGGEE